MSPSPIERIKQAVNEAAANFPDLRDYIPHLSLIGFAVFVGIAMGFSALSVRPASTDARDRWSMPQWNKYHAGPKRDVAQNAVWLEQPGKRKTVVEIKPVVPPWRFIGTEQDGKRRFAVIEFDQGSRVQRVAAGEPLPNGASVLSIGNGELTYAEDNTEKTLAVFGREKDKNFPSGEKKK